MHPESNAVNKPFMTVRDIIRRARAYRKAAKWSHSRMAREAGFKHDTALQRLDDRRYNPSAKTLEMLEKFLGDWRPGDPAGEDAA